jgi:hypothetical protein
VNGLSKGYAPDRSKINVKDAYEVFYWSKAFGVTKQKVQATVAKVGNSVKAVSKELGLEPPKEAGE